MYRWLRDLRKNRDLTQKELAKLLSCTTSAYSKIEHGKRTLTAEISIDLSNFYNVSTDYPNKI